MNYLKGDYYVIEDNNYKAKRIIGQIIKKEGEKYLVYVFYFPEDTVDGRSEHMSTFEVFLTSKQALYEFNGYNAEKVEVVTFNEYINKKYKSFENQNLTLYYWRQSYNENNGVFTPEELPSICYCKQIFNPDIPFAECKCGKYFHKHCLMQSKSGKCLNINCNYDCNNFLGEEEQIIKFSLLYGKDNDENIPTQKKLEDDNDKKMLNKKTSRAKENSFSKEKREKVRNKIYKNLIKGKQMIQSNLEDLDKYDKYKDNKIFNYIKTGDKSILEHLKQLSEKIEEKLFQKSSNEIDSYFNYLRIFKINSIDLFIKIVVGEYTPEEISQFTEQDFLSEVLKKEQKGKKRKEIDSEKEIEYEGDNNTNILAYKNNENECNQMDNDYKEKIKKKQKDFPNLDKDDIPKLVGLNEPNESMIKNQLIDIDEKNLRESERKDFLDKRNNKLKAKPKKIISKEKKASKNTSNESNEEGKVKID